MKKIICKREYDTETAELVKKVTVGEFGEPSGYEESLYQTPGGLYFSLYRREYQVRFKGKGRRVA